MKPRYQTLAEMLRTEIPANHDSAQRLADALRGRWPGITPAVKLFWTKAAELDEEDSDWLPEEWRRWRFAFKPGAVGAGLLLLWRPPRWERDGG